MKGSSRTKNSIFNLISGFAYRLLIMLSAFVVRTVFVRCLNEVYLGVNGLYSNILSMLSLAELGFGTAMVFSMYKPLAEKDNEKLAQLMNLYKKVYSIIGTVILVVGLILIPFLPKLIKNQPNIEGLTFYYILFLLNSVFSYWFFAYRNSLLQADQKAYVISNYNSIFNIIKSVLQIVLLLIFKNFTLYLVTQIICTIGQNFAIAVKVKKSYDIFGYKNAKLPKNETKKIFKDVKALMLSRIAHVALNSTDNIIISSFIGISEVGLLSNMMMISEALTGILCQVTGAIQASVGNFFATKEKEDGFLLFKKIDFLNFYLYGFCTIALITLLNPFITLWLGEKFVMSQSVAICLSINFFVAGIMNALWTFRSTLGLFTQGQYRPIIVAVINIGISILLSLKLGVAGVLAGTFISRTLVNLWYDPYIIFKNGFEKSVKPYYFKFVLRLLLLAAITTLMQFISNIVFSKGITILSFAVMVVITAIIPNLIFLLVFFKTDEFKYFYNLAKSKLLRK